MCSLVITPTSFQLRCECEGGAVTPRTAQHTASACRLSHATMHTAVSRRWNQLDTLTFLLIMGGAVVRLSTRGLDLPLHCRCVAVPLPFRCGCIAVALPLHCRCIAVTLPPQVRLSTCGLDFSGGGSCANRGAEWVGENPVDYLALPLHYVPSRHRSIAVPLPLQVGENPVDYLARNVYAVQHGHQSARPW